MSYIKTNTVLDKILAHKQEELQRTFHEVGETLNGEPTSRMQIAEYARAAAPPRDFLKALQKDTVALIAEVKKASPSKGVLIENFHPVNIGSTYAENGAAAISVLTDAQFFQGSLQYLRQVRKAVGIPVLRKDFIIDPFQVDEARAAGADAVLLIVAALEDGRMSDLYAQIREYEMQALVEVHNAVEMERALKLGTPLIGVNNRDLKTFEVDLKTTGRLAAMVPDDVTLVAESGIRKGEDVKYMGELGARAVLVGESLVKSSDMAASVRELSSQKRDKSA